LNAPEPKRLMDLCEGDQFVGFYVLSRCDLKEHDGGFRLDIELRDASGSLPGVVWDNARDLVQQIPKGSVVKVQGRLLSYQDRPQVKVERIRAAAAGECDPAAFLPKTPKDIGALETKIRDFARSIRQPDLVRLAQSVFGDEPLIREFMRAPGGARWHHPYLGGLAEHTVGVTEICNFVASVHPELNRDLLVLAALLHDIGKIGEFDATTVIEYSDEGRLEGHIILGERFVRNRCDQLENFPPKLKMLLSHLLLSHQGHKEFSTPVEPMIPEAFALYFADEIDAKLNALGRIAEKNPNQPWSEFVKILGRFIYLDRDDLQAGESADS
jgi:3'-5' exoribonuclease